MCLGSFWRPALLLFPLCLIHWQKVQLWNTTGIHISTTDYLTVLEFGLFLICGFLLINFNSISNFLKFYKRLVTKNGTDVDINSSAIAMPRLSPYDVIGFIAICSHLGNYLHSGIKKVVIFDNPFSWTLESQTHYLVLITSVLKQLPLLLMGYFWKEFIPFWNRTFC